MPKISNVYQDKKNGKWYFVASLGYDEKGKRIQHWERGFSTQREAKKAYDEYMNSHASSSIKKIVQCHSKNFMKPILNLTINAL